MGEVRFVMPAAGLRRAHVVRWLGLAAMAAFWLGAVGLISSTIADGSMDGWLATGTFPFFGYSFGTSISGSMDIFLPMPILLAENGVSHWSVLIAWQDICHAE
jgi:hypothetical protein